VRHVWQRTTQTKNEYTCQPKILTQTRSHACTGWIESIQTEFIVETASKLVERFWRRGMRVFLPIPCWHDRGNACTVERLCLQRRNTVELNAIKYAFRFPWSVFSRPRRQMRASHLGCRLLTSEASRIPNDRPTLYDMLQIWDSNECIA